MLAAKILQLLMMLLSMLFLEMDYLNARILER